MANSLQEGAPAMYPARGGEQAAASDDATRTLDLDAQERLGRVKRWWKEDRSAHADWYEEAEECFGFMAGDQWSEEDRAALREQMRPIVTFNRVGVQVDAVGGLEITGRQEVRAIPVGMEDEQASEVATTLLEWGRDGTDAEDEESDAFEDVITCGMGWSETRLDERGRPKIERVDPLEMSWDAGCTRRNLDGCRRVQRAKVLDLDEAMSLWPDADIEDLHADWAGLSAGTDGPVDTTPPRYQGGTGGEAANAEADIKRRGKVVVVETQWSEWVTDAVVPDPLAPESQDGEEPPPPETYSGPQAFTARQRFPRVGIEVQDGQNRKLVVMQGFYGKKELEVRPLPIQGNGFSLKCITGKLDKKNKVFYGLVRGMLDPQRWANKWLSQSMHLLNQGAKKQVLFEDGAFADPDQAKRDWTKPGAFIQAGPGAISNNQIMIRDDAEIPSSLANLLQFAIQSIRDCGGVNLELMGQQTQDQAGVLEYQRREAATTVLAKFFDNLRRYRKEHARYLMQLIVELVPEPLLLRVLNPQQQAVLPMLKQAMGFDLQVDETSSSPNQKERTWALLTQSGMLPLLAQAPPLMAAVIEYSPLPAALASKLSQLLAQMGQQGPPQPTPLQQAQAQKAMADAMLSHARSIQTINEALPPPEGGPQTSPADQALALAKAKLHDAQAIKTISDVMTPEQPPAPPPPPHPSELAVNHTRSMLQHAQALKAVNDVVNPPPPPRLPAPARHRPQPRT